MASPLSFTLDESDASLLSFLTSLRESSSPSLDVISSPSPGVFSSLQTLLPSFPTRSLLLCIDSQPTPAKLSLLQTAALTLSKSTFKQEAARRRKIAEASARLPIPVLDEVNDISMELISSGSDSYVESGSDEPGPEPAFESVRWW